MTAGDDARGSGGRDSGAGKPGAAPAASSNPTPRVVVGSDPGTDPAMAGADTAVASRSQAMSAQTLADEPPSEETLVGQTLLGRYQVTQKIGQGGMGAVYEATHTLIGKRVAVKVLLGKFAQKSPIVARLEQEARLASSIGHEHIIDITDFGQTSDGRTFVVMEYLEGESLHQLLVRAGQLPEQRAIRIARQIASALAAAHAKGIVHRDVKPENVFLLRRSDEDFVKVVDFGISKSLRTAADGDDSPRLTQTGMVLGTPLYMSPEQARGDEDLDHRIDVYALGVIMYEMVTGDVPFRGHNYLSIIAQVLNETPTPPQRLRPDMSEELQGIILRALDKDQNERYQSMDELASDLAALQENLHTTGGDSRTTMQRLRRRARQRSRRSSLVILGWIAGVAVVISAVAVTISVTMSGGSAPEEPAVAAIPPPDAGPPPPDAAPLDPDVEIVVMPVHSDPTGAAIYESGRFIGTAPTDYKAASESRHITLTARLEGYQDAEIPLNPATYDPATDPPVMVTLQKLPEQPAKRTGRRTPRKPPPARAPDAGGGRQPGTAGGDLGGNPYK